MPVGFSHRIAKQTSTLRIVARSADWHNLIRAAARRLLRKTAALDGDCKAISRDPADLAGRSTRRASELSTLED